VDRPAEARVDLRVKRTTGQPESLAVLGKQVTDFWAPFVTSLPRFGALSGRH
jgi:hypothetical protein